MTSPNFPFFQETDLTGAVESLVEGRLSLVDRAIEAIDNAVGGEIANEQTGDENPNIQPNTAETRTGQEEEIDDEVVSRDANVVPNGVINLPEYWAKQEEIKKARAELDRVFDMQEAA